MRKNIFPALVLLFLCVTVLSISAETKVNQDSIKADLKILRNLDFKSSIPWEVKQKEELKGELKKEMDEESTSAELEKAKAFLDWMQLAPENFDITAFLSGYLSQRIAGFYDSKTKMFYICKDKSEMELPSEIKKSSFDYDKITALHEMDHALQDQYFDLERIHKAQKDSKNDDVYYALKDLIEGDATYVTIDAIFKEMDIDLLTVPNLGTLIKNIFSGGQSRKKEERAPYYFSEILSAPYSDGFEFVKNVICVGGWDMVNKIYYDLPDSTEQILHYEKYLFNRDFPYRIKLANVNDELPGGWKKLEENTMGEFQLKVILNQFFPAIDKSTTHTGWGGDTYRLYGNSGKYFSIWFTTWDAPEDAAEFFKTYRKVLDRKFPKMRVKKEKRGKVFEGEIPSGLVFMELKDKSVIVMEKIPQDIFQGLADSLWKSEVTREEHAVTVKASPDQIKIRQPSGMAVQKPAAGSAKIDGNSYNNTYHGFSLIKPDTWIYKEGQYNSRNPVFLANMETGAFFIVSVSDSRVPLNETLMEANVTAAGAALCNNFEKIDSGTTNIGGYYFSFAKGTGVEKDASVPCELRVYGADIKNRVFMLIYLVPQETAEQAEMDFNSILSCVRFE